MKSVRELAAAFDRSFAEPASIDRDRGVDALAIRAGGSRFVLPLSAIGVLVRAPKIVPLPAGSSAQLGLAGIRGSLVVVFSLASLLGEAAGTPCWIVTAAGRRGVAVAFDELEGQLAFAPGEAPAELLDLDAVLTRGGA